MDTFNTTIHTLTEGLRELPTNDITRVTHFLAEYLGDTQHPVPFGGRARDFERLDSWLSEHEGPPYALLAAPAGRGKSALLLRWCQHLLTRSDVAVVYFPVSIRFRTNLAGVVFPALVALLARLHGEHIPNDPHTHEDVWHGLLIEYMTRPLPDGRRLVLVLDGVDEAADWNAGSWLLPENPPADLRVVLSARYLANDRDASAWLTRLGWMRAGLARTLELYPLDRAGIASVLIQMGFPLDLLGTRVDIVSELHRLSEGDPLLIRLYVDDLWERGDAAIRLTPEDLQAIHPGLIGYFERWWNEQRSLWSREAVQREAAMQTLLNLLAGALGPLSKEDILNLAPDASVLHDDQIEQHLEPLQRFVIGDGMRQGYVFSHPRLASYFLEERLSEAERQEIEQRFLNWGARTLADLNAGRLAPEQASPYIVQYYGAHLERAQADVSSLCALVSDGWRCAWEKLDRAHAGFLGDSERAWQAAERANAAAISAGETAPYLDAEIRSLLCRVSINSMTSNISSRLMLEAVKTGVWTPAQGLASIRLLTDLVPRARELVGLAPYVQEPLRTDILQEALDTIATLKNEYDRLDALVELAHGFSPELLAQILETVHAIEDEADRAGMLAELAPALAPVPELMTKALEMAQEIEDEEYLTLALEGLVPFLSEEQQRHALHLAQAIEDERYRALALTALVPHLPAPLLDEILAESRSMHADILHVRLLAQLVGTLPEQTRAEPLQETLALLSEMLDQEYRFEILMKLVPFLPVDKLPGVQKEIQGFWDESYRSRALSDLLPYLPQDQLPAFLDAVLAMKNEEQRAATLLQALPYLPSTLHPTLLESVSGIWDEGRRVEILARLAPTIGADLFPRLFELIQATRDPGYGVWLLAELETSLASRKHKLDLARTFLDVRNPDERLQILLAIAGRISDEALARIFTLMEHEIFGFHGSLWQADRQVDVLTKLAPRMPEAWLPRILLTARTLGKESYQVQALVALAPRIDKSLLPGALDIVRAMKEREKRAQALEALVTVLPEESKGERVREMLLVLQIIKDENERVSVFNAFVTTLTQTLPADRLPEILQAATAMRSENYQASMLRKTIPHLAEAQLETLLSALPTTWSETGRSELLQALVPYLPERLTPVFLIRLQALHEQQQANVLSTLTEHAAPALFTQLLVLIQNIDNQNERSKALARLASRAPQTMYPQIWQALREIQSQGQRAWLLNALAVYLPPANFASFWKETRKIEDRGWQMRIIATLVANLPESSFSLLWTAVQDHPDEQWRALAIRMLAPHVPEPFFPQVFQAALELPLQHVRMRAQVFNEEGPENVLEALAQHIPENFFPQFWKAANDLESNWQSARLREKLAERVPADFFMEIWNTVDVFEENRWRQERLWEKLATCIPERFFAQVWEFVVTMENTSFRNQMLVALVSKVPESFIPRFWKTASAQDPDLKPVHILKRLLPRLPRQMITDVLEVAQALPMGSERLEMLEMLIPLLDTTQNEALLDALLPASETSEEALVDRLTTMRKNWPQGWWERLMVELIPHLPETRVQTLLPAFLQATQDTSQSGIERTLILKKLIHHVPESTFTTLLEVIWSIQAEPGQQELLDMLLSTSLLTTHTWVQMLALAREKTRATGQAHYLLHMLHAAPISLQQTAPAQLYPALHEMIHLLAQLPRRDALIDLAFLAPSLRALGNEETTVASICSVLEIGRWWP